MAATLFNMAATIADQKQEAGNEGITSTPEEVQRMVDQLQANNAWPWPLNIELDDTIGTLVSSSVTNVTQALYLANSMAQNKELYDAISRFFESVGVDAHSCECVADKICSDKTLSTQLCEFWKSFCKRFSKHLPNEMAANHGDSNIDAVKEIIPAMKDKHKELQKTCSPSNFQSELNKIHLQYMVGCFVCLAISWTYIYQTTIAIQESSAELQRLVQKLKKLREDDIDPITEYIKQVQRSGFIRNKCEYERYKIRINTTIKILNEYKDQIEKEKSKMKLKGFNNAISATAMAVSCVTSFNMSGGTKAVQTAMKVTGFLQGGTAVAHSVMSGVCCATYYKLNQFCIELKHEIDKLREAEIILNKCYKDGRYRRQTDNSNCTAYVWDTTQVVNWLKEQRFMDIAKVFEEEGVEGPDLLDMDQKTLYEMVDVADWKQKKLLRKIKNLKQPM